MYLYIYLGVRNSVILPICIVYISPQHSTRFASKFEINFFVDGVPGHGTDEEEHEEPGRVQRLWRHEVNNHNVHKRKQNLNKHQGRE